MQNRTLLPWVVLVLPALVACHDVASAREASLRGGADVALTPEKLEASGIELAAVEEHDVDEVFTAGGRVTFEDTKVAHVVSPVNGRVTALNAALGQRVKKGDTLATIKSPDIGQASAELSKAKADLIAAEHNFKRKKDLFVAKAASNAEYDAAEDTYRQAKAEKDRAEQKARLFHARSFDGVTQGYSLTSPIDGEVIARQVNPGEELHGEYSSGSSMELFTVGELDRVWVMADVYEVDLARVQVGAKVTVSVVAYPERAFEGRVDWIASMLDPATRTVQVRCTFDNPESLLKPEMYATVRISVPGRTTLAIPRGAVVRVGEQAVVFVAGQGLDGKLHFEPEPVTVDEGNGHEPFLPVEHGLEKGKRIVSRGASTIAEMM